LTVLRERNSSAPISGNDRWVDSRGSRRSSAAVSAEAEIRRDERDEYLYVDLGSQAPGRVDGQPASSKPLRTGDRIELGDWTLSFFREECADHDIPGGGRQGGDPHPVQQEPRPRGTSPEGGSDRTAGDPGEYF
jgi:hypothetical protein